MSDFDSIRHEITYRGETTRDNNWKCDEWKVVIRNNQGKAYTTTYFTGLGHRDKFNKPKKPDIKRLIYSLILDADANNYSFIDWCDNYGFDSDSIKAQNTYNECCNIYRELNKLFTIKQIQDMQQALKDY